jgi:integrase/recombinase XerC
METRRGDTGDLILLLGCVFDDMPHHYGASAAAERAPDPGTTWHR